MPKSMKLPNRCLLFEATSKVDCRYPQGVGASHYCGGENLMFRSTLEIPYTPSSQLFGKFHD